MAKCLCFIVTVELQIDLMFPVNQVQQCTIMEFIMVALL